MFHQDGGEPRMFPGRHFDRAVFWELQWKCKPLMTSCGNKTHGEDTKALRNMNKTRREAGNETLGEGSGKVLEEGEEDVWQKTAERRESSSKWPFHLHASAATYLVGLLFHLTWMVELPKPSVHSLKLEPLTKDETLLRRALYTFQLKWIIGTPVRDASYLLDI